MYTAAADTQEEDIDHFLPPPPTASLLEMCWSNISATQPVPVAYLYDTITRYNRPIPSPCHCIAIKDESFLL